MNVARTTDRVGYDVGGVIQGGRGSAAKGQDTSFLSSKNREEWINVPPNDGAIQTIADLTRLRFGGENSFIVSKCGKATQDKTLQWFDHIRFYEATGILPENVHFCRERHQKAGICRELGITYFVDDRLEVLGHMIGIVPQLLLFNPDPREAERFARFRPSVFDVADWWQVRGVLLR